MSDTITLEALVGRRMLTGVDRGPPHKEDPFSDTLSFVLGGITYTVVEDPNDGYRSSMNRIFVSDLAVKNTFTPCEVLCAMDESRANNTLVMRDTTTGKVVLRVGTDDIDDYYPCFVAEFSPENMASNVGRTAE